MANQFDDGVAADVAVDGILHGLEQVRDARTVDHAAIYAQLHDQLLAELDADPADPAEQGPGPIPGPGA